MTDRWARKLPFASDPLFVYGTLRFGAVLTELIGRVPEMAAARVLGRRAAALPGRVYPGLVAAAAGVTDGFLLTGLTADEWLVLDAFEDDEYDLVPVSVSVGERVGYAWTYVWTAEVEERDWSASEFATEQLPSYVGKCAAWRRDVILLSETV
ncbi:gamma-glutamylcyclotransferase family protein [Nocardia sp. CDC160]|uniref:gamma-glutamylcyclotransferase family protein n=1 Tax=Nocardia sp. CDC160 TaxID=3112166 RepID=UPI002DC014C1|nr:gamma-glutamylcyclotransferase family protein [Nocardia sp. CDC160]MEC3914585.1 gamma-glutamylcyclotransferase family protein [Nocardia sp. CDC160]